MPTISEALALAIQHHQAGRLQAAEQIYRQILQADPNHAEAIHLLGVLAHQVGKHELAVEYIGRAIGLKGNAADFHYNLAKAHQALGRLPEAVASGRRAVDLRPDYAEAYNNLGNALRDQGKPEEAITCLHRALALKPDLAEAHSSLANAFRDQGKLDEATASFRRALAFNPHLAEAHNNLGIALKDQGRLEEADACFRRALELNPDLAEVHSNLGLVFLDQKRVEEAIACFRRALALKPDYAVAHHNLGLAFMEQRKLEEAAACCRRALELRPELVEAHSNLGLVLKDQGNLEEAVASIRRALALRPDYALAYNNLGLAFAEQKKPDEAIACYRRALALNPGLAEARNNLGVAYKDQGKLDEAAASYREAMALEPQNDAHHSNLLNLLHYLPAYDAVSIHGEHRRWNRQFSEPLRAFLQPHPNEPDPERPLRIGYVSPDFCDHVVGRNVLPILERHDHARFVVFCYASVARPDALTRRFQAASDVWRNIVSMPDDAVADLIRTDRIDLLIDLSLHTAGHRLAVFARKPAPVQITWAGYPGATGLETIDYRLTDPYLDPPGAPEEHGSEKPIRLPHSFWCYDAGTGSPPVHPSPALGTGRITFGSLNNYCKVNAGVIALWARVLGAVEGSRLLLLSKEGTHREQALKAFERGGVAADRVEWFTPAARLHYLAAYHRIDLGLDTFPYNGHTTSLDSTWMGVPVVTLVGSTVVGRAGLSQSMNLGLPELIAYDPEQYLRVAAELARDRPRLSRLRATLRDRMQASPLMDAASFTRSMEAAYRETWQWWVRTRASGVG